MHRRRRLSLFTSLPLGAGAYFMADQRLQPPVINGGWKLFQRAPDLCHPSPRETCFQMLLLRFPHLGVRVRWPSGPAYLAKVAAKNACLAEFVRPVVLHLLFC